VAGRLGVALCPLRRCTFPAKVGLKRGPAADCVVVTCRLPSSTDDDLVAKGYVRTRSIPGTNVPETVFSPAAFPRDQRRGRVDPHRAGSARVCNADGVIQRGSLPLDGTTGRGPELLSPDPEGQLSDLWTVRLEPPL
jgi:hypothetical protein